MGRGGSARWHAVGAKAAQLPLPDEAVLYFEADASEGKATGGHEGCVFRDGKASLCFGDGHVKLLSEDETAKRIWEPSKNGK